MIDIDAKEEEMGETDPLVKDTGDQEIQRKVLRLRVIEEKGCDQKHLFFCAHLP